MYEKKSTDISIIVSKEMYRKRQNYILRTVLIVFLILTSSALKVDLCFVKKILTFIICHQCDRIGVLLIYLAKLQVYEHLLSSFNVF